MACVKCGTKALYCSIEKRVFLIEVPMIEMHNSSPRPGENAKNPTKSIPLYSVEDVQAHF